MANDPSLSQQVQRIAEIVEQIESTADPNLRAMAQELLESLMALHGAALERMLEIAFASGDAGQKIVRECGQDDMVSSVLVLYGIHPDDLRTRVERAVEKLKPMLASHSAQAELVAIDDNGAARLRLNWTAHGCGSSAASVKSSLEAAVQDAAPDASSVLIEEIGAPQASSGFVPLAQLAGAKAQLDARTLASAFAGRGSAG
jgi:Fe-S cluster biogenesis protein NfuA